MLFTHHFDSSLGWIKVEFVVLLSSLTCFVGIFLIVEFAICLVIFGTSIKCVPSILSLRNIWSHRTFLIELWQREIILWRLIISLRLRSKFTPGHTLNTIYISDIILHQYQMRILIRSLLCLSLFDSIIQKLNSFFVFFFKFGFDALILNILKPVHLEAILLLLSLAFGGFTSNGLILLHSSWNVPCGVLNCLIFLGFLSHLSEFNVTFIENYFLNIVCRHLSHEKALGISIFVTLNNFIFKTDKL